MRSRAAITFAVSLSLAHISAQTKPSAEPAFDVASIKPNVSSSPGTEFGLPGGGRFTATNATARELVRMAHSVQDYQLVGLPDWTNSARYDINARANENIALTGDPSKPTPVFQMLASLLADRFKLRVHRETREMPVYALVMARAGRKLGPRLTPSKTDGAAVFAALRAKAAATGGTTAPSPTDAVVCGRRNRPGYVAGGALDIGSLVPVLSGVMGRMVIDRTGLTERYDFVLEYRIDQVSQSAPAVNPDAPSLETALQEQLGLKLEATTAPVEVLVVDSISQPTPD